MAQTPFENENAAAPLVDLSFVYEMSGNDSGYVYDVIGLFLSIFPGRLEGLEMQMDLDIDYDLIEEQAHFLKSSSSIIKVRGLYEGLVKVEKLARARGDRNEIKATLTSMNADFREALPILVAEQMKNKPAEQ